MKSKEDFKKKDVVTCIDKKSKSIYHKLGHVVFVGTDKKIGVEFDVKVVPKHKVTFKCKKPENCALLDSKHVFKLPKDIQESGIAAYIKQNKGEKGKIKKKKEEQTVEFIENEEEGD